MFDYEEVPGKFPLTHKEESDLFVGFERIRNLIMTHFACGLHDPPALDEAIDRLGFQVYESGYESLQYPGSEFGYDLYAYALKRLKEEHGCILYTLRRKYKNYSHENEHKCVMLSHPRFERDLPAVMLMNEPQWRESVEHVWGYQGQSVMELVDLILDKLLRSDEKFDPVSIVQKRWLELE